MGEEAGGMFEWTFSAVQLWCTLASLVQLNPQIRLLTLALCGIPLLVWDAEVSNEVNKSPFLLPFQQIQFED